MKIANHDVLERVLLVAELSGNHAGQFRHAKALIHAAKAVGANAVKLQCFLPEEMADPDDDPIPTGPWAGRTLFELYTQTQTPRAWFPELFQLARGLGLVPFASVFGLDSLQFLEDLGCPAYKVSSFELGYLPLLEAVAKTGRPVLLSTGMADEGAELEAQRVIRQHVDIDPIFLHCVSGYPTPALEANLGAIQDIGVFGIPGLSYHARSPILPAVAVGLGARVIEAHLTLDHRMPTADGAFSMDPEEFEAMVRAVRETEAALQEHPTPSEDPQRGLRRRQLKDGRWLRRVRP